MGPLSLMIKPASGRCNMRCKYCFYTDEMESRKTPDFGMMAENVLETLIRKALEHATGSCTFGYQGGEPTLRGIAFFEKAVAYQKKYNVNNVKIQNAFQTNGLAVDGQWAEFFRKEKFLVGLSIDGTARIHNRNRLDSNGEGTLRRVIQAAECLRSHHADFNVLTVVTDETAMYIDSIYDFFQRYGLVWQQYIPCLDPMGQDTGWLSSERYALLLCRLFDRWAADVRQGRFIYIRQFENYIAMLHDLPPDTCSMTGQCTPQYVIEADGSVYPCDFYALDQWRLGSIYSDSFETLDERREDLGFIQEPLLHNAQCAQCRYYPLCRGGCRRERESVEGLQRTKFCRAYQNFFAYAWDGLHEIAIRSV